MKIDCQKLLPVNLQNSALGEGRGPGRMPMWHRNTFLKVLKNLFVVNLSIKKKKHLCVSGLEE